MRVIPERSVVCSVQSHTMFDNTHTWGQPPLASDPFWDDSSVKVKYVGRINAPKQDKIVCQFCSHKSSETYQNRRTKWRAGKPHSPSHSAFGGCVSSLNILILDSRGGAKDRAVKPSNIKTPIGVRPFALWSLSGDFQLIVMCIYLLVFVVVVFVIVVGAAILVLFLLLYYLQHCGR